MKVSRRMRQYFRHLGRQRMAKLTSEQRSELAARAVNARWARKNKPQNEPASTTRPEPETVAGTTAEISRYDGAQRIDPQGEQSSVAKAPESAQPYKHPDQLPLSKEQKERPGALYWEDENTPTSDRYLRWLERQRRRGWVNAW
jgi:hypothetical protein